MIVITSAHMEELQRGKIPNDLNQRLRDDINFMLNQEGEAIVSFHPTSYCIYADIVETEFFNDEEMEDIKSDPYAVIKTQD